MSPFVYYVVGTSIIICSFLLSQVDPTHYYDISPWFDLIMVGLVIVTLGYLTGISEDTNT